MQRFRELRMNGVGSSPAPFFSKHANHPTVCETSPEKDKDPDFP